MDRSVEFFGGAGFWRKNKMAICSVGTVLTTALALESVQCSQCSEAKIAVGTGKTQNLAFIG